ERRNFDRGAERRFPWRQGQIQVQIAAVYPIQPMRRQRYVQVDIAVGPAVRALSTLSCKTQHLRVHYALWNPRPQRSWHALRDALLVEFGCREVQSDLGPAI